MATNIDQRIVEMQFDNAQFEKGVSTSLQSLENLKKSLNLDDALTSISNIEKSFNKMNFDSVADSIESIAGHFTTLGRNVDKIIDNIVQSAVSKLSSIGKSISVDQVGAGFSKYADQTKAVQTITNATGKSVEEVEVVLSKLQKYTDETSYDFTTMASTIGKFTSVGVELERAELAMEGIANEAALSGAGKAEANRAMYNFAQSLSSGSVKLIDWKSIENANMATKEFKEELIKTAIELGTINKTSETTGSIMKQTKAATSKTAAQFKETEVNYKSFNETLSEGWLTSDVLITTLARYADSTQGVGEKAYIAAQKALTWTDAIDAIKDAVSSSWMQSFKYIFGDLNEAIDLWTNFCTAIIEVTDAIGSYRNELLQGWHEQGGYNDMIEAASNIWTAFTNVLSLVHDSFVSVIPPWTSDTLLNITSQLKSASESLVKLFNYNGIIEVEEEVEKLVNYASEFADNIEKGMTGDYVKLFQQALINAGYSLDKFGADGIYGSETKNAIKALQKDLGVSETGEWDEATRKAAILSGKFQAIEKATETVTKNIGETYEVEQQEVEKIVNLGHQLPQKLLQEGDIGDDVKDLQEALVKMGYLDEKLADGIYGPKTRAAVEQLQKDYNLTQESGLGVFDVDMRDQIISLELYTETVKEVGTATKTVGAQNSYMERLYKTMQGVAAAWSIVTNLFSLGAKVLSYVVSLFAPVADGFLTIASAVGTCLVSLNDFLNESGAYETWFNSIKTFLQPFATLLKGVGDSINNFFLQNKDIKTFTELWKALRTELSKSKIWKTILDYLDKFVAFVEKAKSVIIGLYGTAKKWISEKFTYLFAKGNDGVTNLQKGVTDMVNTVKTKFDELSKKYPIIKTLGEYFENAKKTIGDFVTSAKNKFSTFFDSMGNFNSEEFLGWVTEKFNSIKQSISTFVTESGKKFDTFKSNISDAFTAFKNKIEELRKKYPIIDNIANAFETLGTTISTVWGNIKEIFTKAFEGGAFDKGTFFDTIKQKFEDLKTALDNTIKYIKIKFARFQMTHTGFSKVFQTVKDVIQDIKNLFDSLVESVKNFFSTDFSAKNTFAEKLQAAMSAFQPVADWFIGIKDKIVEAWKKLTNLGSGEGGGGSGGGFFSIIGEAKKYFEGFKDFKWSSIIIPALSAGAIYMLVKSGGIFGNISKAFKNFSTGFLIKSGGKQDDQFGTMLIKLASAVAIVALSVGLLSMADVKKVYAAVGAITAMFAAIVGIGLVAKGLGGGDFGKDILMLSASVAAIAVGLEAMILIVGSKGFKEHGAEALTLMGGVLIGLAAVEIIISKFGGSESGMGVSSVLGMCAGLVLIAAAIGALTIIIDKYGAYAVDQAFWYIEGILLTLGAISVLTSAFSKNSKGTKIKGILSMCIGVLLIAVAFDKVVKAVDKYGSDTAKLAFAGLEILLLSLGGLAALINRSNSNFISGLSSVATIIAMGLMMEKVVGAFSTALDMVKDVDMGIMITFFTGTETAMGVLAGIVMLFGNMPVATFIGSAGIVAVMTALGLGIDAFASLGSDALDKFSTAIWVLGSKLKNFSSMIENVNFDLFPKVVTGVETLVSLFTESGIYLVNKDSVEGFALAIQYLGSALNIFNTSVSKIEDWSIFSSNGALITGIKNLASLANSSDIVNANPQYGINYAIAIQKIASGLANMSASLTKVNLDTFSLRGPLYSAIATTLLIVRTIVAENIAGSSATSGFSNAIQTLGGGLSNSYTNVKDIPDGAFDNAKSLVDSSIEIILKLNNPILWAASKTISNTLEEISAALKLYYGNIKDISFDDGGATPEQIKAAFTGLANNMPDESSITDVAKYANDTEGAQYLLDFAEGLVNLGTAIEQYGTSIGTLKSDDVNTANSVLEAVSSLKESLSISNFLSLATELITHEDSNPIGDFATDITVLGSALENYASSIGGKLTEDDVKNSNSVLETVAGITTTLSDTTLFFGFMGFTTSNKDVLSNFATDIETLGSALENYGSHLYNSNLTSTKVNLANSVLKAVAETSVVLTDDSNFFQFMGWVPSKNETLSSFANNIGQLGSALENYANGIGNLSWFKVTTANTVLEKVAGLDIKATGGLWGLLTGDSSLSTFASNLGSIGDGIKQFSDAIADSAIDKINMTKALKPLNTLADAQAKLEKTGGLSALISGENNLGKLGSQFKEFGEYISAFSGEVINFDETKIKSIMGVLEQVIGLYERLKGESDIGYKIGDLGAGIYTFLSQLDQSTYFTSQIETWRMNGVNLVNSFVSGFSSAVTEENKQRIKSGFIILLFQGTRAISDSTQSFTNTTNDLIQNGMGTPIESSESINKIQHAITTLAGYGVKSARDTQGAFRSAGQWLVYGLELGLRDRSNYVKDMARSVAINAYNAAKSELRIDSPSKLFIEIGEFVDLGFAKGLDEYSGRVYSSAENVSSEAISGAQKGLSDFSSLVFDEMSDEPVIRPVLDLSEVQAGVAGMNGMFGTQTVGVRSAAIASSIAAGTMRNDMEYQQQANSNSSDIKSTLEQLNGRIDELGQRISNMKVVTETGAIIGQITNGIDRSLADKSILAKRGAI